RHRRDVALKRVEIDEQRRRVQTVAAAGLTDKRGVGAQSLCHGCYPRKWQATRCPGFTLRIAGSSTRQRAPAEGQRVWKRQPVGGLIGLGTSPERMIRRRGALGSCSGTAESSASV